ncbi:MAG: serine/threonine protein kinase, partial [Gemmataceae bacterium]|nr:serine/threonine protein kinase [Gemmataceae bacterium]
MDTDETRSLHSPVLGSYRLGASIGRGGMGAVHEAVGPGGESVAVKVMLPGMADEADARARFLREGRLAQRVAHPNVVRVIAAGEEGPTVFLVMERLRGETLSARLRREGPQPPERVRDWARQIAAGLAAAHAAGLVHRDLKPSNLWLDESGTVKILDFGLARAADPDSTRLTSTGAVVGTPSYMAPEQARGEKADERTDLFALGCVLFHALAGRPPYEAKDAVSTLVQVVASGGPPDVRAVRKDAPPDLARLVSRLLHPDPAKRPAAAEEALREVPAPVP